MAQIFADQDASDFPTTTQYNTILDLAGKEVWYDLLKAGYPVNFSTTIITASGATFYPLSGGNPSVTGGVVGVHGVYFIQGADYYPMERVNEGHRAALLSSTFMPSGYAGFYNVMVDPTSGIGVELLPKPVTGSYKVDYIPEWPGFASDVAVWTGPARSDQLVALKAAYYGVKKEGSARAEDAASLDSDYGKLLQNVQDTASWLDLRNPAQIRDVMSQKSRFVFDYPIAGPDRFGY